jgi:type I restriction enzyme S subunit
MRAAQPHLNAEELGNCRILLPPKPDQEQVVLYLDKHAAYLDKILTKINMSITTLREYRTTRISAAVTGTIDVCEDLT